VPRSHPTDALGLVKLCVGQMGARGIDIGQGDMAICVFDIEGNDASNLSRAIKLARQSGVLLAMTDPCFERWFLVHFQDVMASVPCAEVHQSLKDHIDNYHKTGVYHDTLDPLRRCAMTRAQGTRSEDNKSSIPSNPGTTMNLVLSEIEQLVQHNSSSP